MDHSFNSESRQTWVRKAKSRARRQG